MNRLLLVGCLLLASCATTAANDVSTNLDQYLRRREQQSDFSGAVIVERRGVRLLDSGYGKADYELGASNDTSKIFRIGSVSKPFTAIAILKLQEEKKLSIDDPLCNYLPSCPIAWQPVTLRHLLSHTSGIPDYFGEVRAGPTSQMRALIDETVKAHATSALRTTPGDTYSYSNFGYLLLAYVCEVAGRESWEDVLRTRIFIPAGMNDTAYDDVFAIVPRRVRGYDSKGPQLRNVDNKDHGAFAAGGLRSTARDLLSWQHALRDGRIVNRATFESMISPVHGNYALGWQSMKLFGRPAINHTGEINGFSSHVVHYLDDDVTIIVLSNFSREPAKTTACDLARIVFGSGQTLLDRPLNIPILSSEQLDRLTGEYSDGEVVRRINRRGDRLEYQRDQDNLELTPAGNGRFIIARSIQLQFDSSGSFTMTDGCDTEMGRFRRTR